MSRIAEEMASLHRVAQEHAVNEELVLKIINGLKEEVLRGRQVRELPGDYHCAHYRDALELVDPRILSKIPIRLTEETEGVSYAIGYLNYNYGHATVSDHGISGGGLTKKDYQSIGPMELALLEQNGIKMAIVILHENERRNNDTQIYRGVMIYYTPGDQRVPVSVRVSAEAEAMASASSSSAPRSASRPRAPRVPRVSSRSASRPRTPRSSSRSAPSNVLPVIVTEEMGELTDPITLESIPVRSHAVRLECGHILSKSSYTQLRRNSTVGDKCPTCRHPIHD
jgi:hypothetical protein